VEQKTEAPLRGVVVCVSKKLSKKQSELNAVAASLGADFRYVTNHNIILHASKTVPAEMLVRHVFE